MRAELPAIAKLALLCQALLLTTASVRASVGSSTEFSMEQFGVGRANQTAILSRKPARSDIECAALAAATPAASAGLFRARESDCLLLGAGGGGGGASQSGLAIQPEERLLLKEWSTPEPVPIGNEGFTIIQQRSSGRVSFAGRTWAEYKAGFGDATEFWLGLDAIHNLTNGAKPRLLRIELTPMSGAFHQFEFSNFSVQSEANQYAMTFGAALSNATGAASLNVCNGKLFSTTDKDNVPGPKKCFSSGSSGWWFDDDCTSCNLNGGYNTTAATVGETRFYWDGASTAADWIRACRMIR